MARKPPPPDDPTTVYARDVVAGRTVAGRFVRLACQRHLDDLEAGCRRGLSFDVRAAAHAIEFFALLSLAEGEYAGQPFVLQPWQKFIVGSLFGWKTADGTRRYRTAYCEIGKGNGKTPLAAGIGLYGLLADGEAGAEIYSAATTREQASILFRDAKNMTSASRSLASRLDIGVSNIAHLPSRSFFRPVSSEHKGLDGKRVHMALIDEVHEHTTSLVVDKMRAGTKGRRQALILEITNSGHDRSSVCWQHHDYSADVLLGKRTNDSWFAFVCGLDLCAEHVSEGKTQPVDGCARCDDWRDERTWRKANPNLGVSVTERYLREQVEEAQGMPAKEGIVRRLNFCHWTEGMSPWLPADLWSRGAGRIDEETLRGCTAFGGVDVASKVDVAAFVLAFPDCPEPGQTALRCWFFIPEETATERQQAEGVPWRTWAREGWVALTPGDGISLDVIEAAIKEAASTYLIKDIAFDDWNAVQMATHLADYGIDCVKFSQNLRNFNEPSKEFELLLKQGRLRHGSNPVLDWMASNVAVVTDASGNIRPVKPEHGSHKKVDGIVAAVMALGRAMLVSALDCSRVEVW